jgi:hypothetical protein
VTANSRLIRPTIARLAASTHETREKPKAHFRINYARRNLNVLTGDELSSLLNNYVLQNIAASVLLSKFVVYKESKRSQFSTVRLPHRRPKAVLSDVS